MAFLDHQGGADFPYSREVVFDAMLKAIPTVGMRVHQHDRGAGLISAKAGVSLMSWGENIPISITEIAPTKSRVSITSTPKTGVLFGGAFDLGKNRGNIEKLLFATARILSPDERIRTCPNCKGAMGRGESVCPHCGTPSTPWVFHAGVWWSKGRSDEWQWVDEKTQTWRWYKDGTPSDPAATDKTPNLMIDPAVVSPPDAPKLEAVTASPQRQQTDSFAGELERLADLHDRGALSDEQFEAAKARLLGL